MVYILNLLGGITNIKQTNWKLFEFICIWLLNVLYTLLDNLDILLIDDTLHST